jgi:hypothetical protein
MNICFQCTFKGVFYQMIKLDDIWDVNISLNDLKTKTVAIR